MPGWAHEIRHVEETLRAPQWLRFVAVHGSGIGHVGPKQMRQACSQPVEPDMQPQETDSRFGIASAADAWLCSVLCRFSDAGNDDLATRSGDRRPKSAKARNRGRYAPRPCRRLSYGGLSGERAACMPVRGERWSDCAGRGMPAGLRGSARGQKSEDRATDCRMSKEFVRADACSSERGR